MCDQQRLRPACAYAQSDQSHCYSLEYSMTVNLLTEHHFVCLSSKGGYTGVSESTLVKIPQYWKARVAAQIYHFCKVHTFLLYCFRHMVPQTRLKWLSHSFTCTSIKLFCLKRSIYKFRSGHINLTQFVTDIHVPANRNSICWTQNTNVPNKNYV